MGAVVSGRADGSGRGAGGTRKGLGRLRVGVERGIWHGGGRGREHRVRKGAEAGCSQSTCLVERRGRGQGVAEVAMVSVGGGNLQI